MSHIPKFLLKYIPHGHCNDELPMDWQSLFTRILMMAARKLYGGQEVGAWASVRDCPSYDDSIAFIENSLRSGQPFMAGKIGTGDMETLQRYIDIKADGNFAAKWWRLISGKSGPFWFDNWIRAGICI